VANAFGSGRGRNAVHGAVSVGRPSARAPRVLDRLRRGLRVRLRQLRLRRLRGRRARGLVHGVPQAGRHAQPEPAARGGEQCLDQGRERRHADARQRHWDDHRLSKCHCGLLPQGGLRGFHHPLVGGVRNAGRERQQDGMGSPGRHRLRHPRRPQHLRHALRELHLRQARRPRVRGRGDAAELEAERGLVELGITFH
jgi:hypothetical protein